MAAFDVKYYVDSPPWLVELGISNNCMQLTFINSCSIESILPYVNHRSSGRSYDWNDSGSGNCGGCWGHGWHGSNHECAVVPRDEHDCIYDSGNNPITSGYAISFRVAVRNGVI